MHIYQTKDYRSFIRQRLEQMPKKGRGQLKRIAAFLDIQTSMLSQIMAGRREMNPESAALLCEFFGLNELESDTFLCLVQLARAGNPRLRSHLERQLATFREKAARIENRVTKDNKLDESVQALFYSQWYYSGVRLLSDVEGHHNVDVISERLRLPRALVARVVTFLVKHDLCVLRDGKLSCGPRSTHIGADSSLVARHHANWRMKAMENFEGLKPWELVFTSPVAVSRDDAESIRHKLLDAVEGWAKVIDRSPSERFMCLNIDWVEIE